MREETWRGGRGSGAHDPHPTSDPTADNTRPPSVTRNPSVLGGGKTMVVYPTSVVHSRGETIQTNGAPHRSRHTHDRWWRAVPQARRAKLSRGSLRPVWLSLGCVDLFSSTQHSQWQGQRKPRFGDSVCQAMRPALASAQHPPSKGREIFPATSEPVVV